MSFPAFFSTPVWMLPVLLSLLPASGEPVLIFAADDQASVYLPTEMKVLPKAGVGALTSLDFGVYPPRLSQLEGVPCSVIGPPTCIAATGDGGTILVAGAMKVDPSNPEKLIPGDKITWLSWGLGGLKMRGQLAIGIQPSGVALTRDGRRALVTLRGEGAIAVLDIGEALSLKRKVVVADPASSVAHIALSPDGRTALATLHESNAVLFLDVSDEGNLIPRNKFPLGKGPYSAVFIDNLHVLVACTMDDAVYTLEKRKGHWGVSARTPVGRIPEGLALSADRKMAAVSCFDGIMVADPKNPWYGQPSRVHLFDVDGEGRLIHPQAIDAESMVQSAVFTPDSRHLVIGQYGQGNISIFEKKSDGWVDTGLRLKIPGQVAALSVAGH